MIAGTEEQGGETPEEYAFYIKMMEDSKRRIQLMKNKYAGEDCFLIGNGPSLNVTDFSLIRDKHLFGVNVLYKAHKKFDIAPQFYGLSDGLFLGIHGDEILSLKTQLFLTRSVEIQYLRNYEHYHKIVYQEPILLRSLLPEMDQSKKFSKDVSEGIYSGWTTIIDTGLQVCYYLGFNRVVLLGCDCDYTIRSFCDNTKNFLNGNLQNMKKWFKCYEICKQAYEEDGREIINATNGGRLEIFKRRKLEEIK